MDRLAYLRMFLGKLARGEEPYGGGRFDADHLKIFADDARLLEGALDELAQRRASVTTGGPPAPFTERWVRGPSSRPSTAPPLPDEVELPGEEEP